MILAGTLAAAPEPVNVRLVADVAQFTEAMARAAAKTDDLSRFLVSTARAMTTLNLRLEVLNLTVDQTWTLFYTRGGMHPDFSDEAGRDNYLRVLTRLNGAKGRAAVEGFLRGWAEHHHTPVDSFVWHRLIGGVEMRVSAA